VAKTRSERVFACVYGLAGRNRLGAPPWAANRDPIPRHDAGSDVAHPVPRKYPRLSVKFKEWDPLHGREGVWRSPALPLAARKLFP
jgi:hypothetical protein